MNFQIIHSLPRRMRISLHFPKRYTPDSPQIEKMFSGVEGIREVSFNYRTRSLLVKYDGSHAVRDALFTILREIPLVFVKRESPQRSTLEQKKRTVTVAGVLLAARPLIPSVLAPAITLYGALSVLKKGIRAILKKRLNVDTLDATAVSISFVRGEYLAASLITFFLKVGDYLEEKIRQKSRESLSKMLHGDDEWVWVRRDGREAKIHVNDIVAGDLVVVRMGSCIPVDGVVVEGAALVNQSSITGEPFPVPKRTGLGVYAGTILEEGLLTIKSIRVGDDTRIARVIRVIEQSEGLKADAQNHAEGLANGVVPYSFLTSMLVYLFTGNPARAVSVLLVDYSCALKLSTPLTFMSAMITASKHGILIKGGKVIEKLAQADAFVFDKTGTLTEAKPRVFDLVPLNGFSREYLLKNVACVEEHFPHPVATAIVRKAEEEGILHEENHAEVDYILAHGIASKIKGKRILVGSKHFISEDSRISIKGEEPAIQEFVDRGFTILYIAIENKLAGIIAVEDTLRADVQGVLDRLKGMDVERIIMLTGDNDAAARNVAKRLGIEEYHAQVLPERKTEIVKGLKDEGHVVAMVGDGINDSSALSLADVGISMKHGADIAKEACDILLLEVKLGKIIDARILAQNTMSRIKQNFKYIIGMNSALIGFGILGIISPVASAFLHNAATILVSAHSLRKYPVVLKPKEDG